MDSAETPEDGMYYMINKTDFKQTLTHRYVMYQPCAVVLDSTGMMEIRAIFGFPTPLPQSSGYVVEAMNVSDQNHLASEGFAPKPCSFDHNGNGLGDGWEDQNNDVYADGFTDYTKPYVLMEDDWYMCDLRRTARNCSTPPRSWAQIIPLA